ncbi:MAG: TRAM domain-containing protein [Parachlamydia sp.]|nr:TRAM domain-containing protein [Parachlamydia sp.]
MIFFGISILFSFVFATQHLEGGINLVNSAVGLLGGIIFAGLLIGADMATRKFNLKSINTAALGLFFGYFFAESILFILTGMLGIPTASLLILPIRFVVYLTCAYVGLVMTARATDEIHLSIPFIEFKAQERKKKDILIDVSVLMDPRIIDLASSGVLDHHLILPRYALKELYSQAENADETIRSKARRSLDVIKKLESISTLDLRYDDTDFPEINDAMAKLIRLARFLDTNIITSDINRIQQSSIEGVRIINIHMLSNALKPITQAGEVINIKIQRYGKEARQGVGYLEDGTMVVVNGGAEFIGETIKGHVLSVKHTSSGRMIFCNASEEGILMMDNDDFPSLLSESEIESTHKNYLAL